MNYQARRKTSRDAAAAFISSKPYRSKNTVTDGTRLYLFGNLIAEKRGAALWITNAGWSTATTKERLNALPGVSITQKAGIWYLNGAEWSGKWAKVHDFEDPRLEAFSLEENTIDADISYRGGKIKIDASELFPEYYERTGERAIVGAYQNYLGGGIAGRIVGAAMFQPEELTEEERALFDPLLKRCVAYFHSLNNGGGDEYMQENYSGLDFNQTLPTSAY